MASLETLPADQRAVLALVLQRGRSYDEIAEMLSIDRAAVRDRALQALDALGPGTQVEPGRRALITDYLLGQLPSRVASDTHDRLAQSAPERAWARVIASELSSLAPGALPEIPAAAPASSPREDPAQAPAPPSRRGHSEPLPPGPEPAAPEAPAPVYGRESPGLTSRAGSGRRSSRRGGVILLAVAGAAVLALVLNLILNSGGSSKNTTSAAASPTSTAGGASTSSAVTATSATASAPRVVAQINLFSPQSSRTKGVVTVFRRQNQIGILLNAQHLPPNTTHDSYAVWLFSSPTHSIRLGWGPIVGASGRLSTLGSLPANASQYKQLIVTRETARNPLRPGTIVLQGTLTGVS